MISAGARAIEKMLKFTAMKNNIRKYSEVFLRDEKYSKPSKLIIRNYDIVESEVMGRNCYTINSSKNSETHIMFFHGGAYTSQASVWHWRTLSKIIKKVDCTITFVDYPLAPEYTCTQTIKMVTSAYKHFFHKDENKNIVLLGDSSGAGLALALAQIIKVENILPKPNKIVLLSPWLDVSMTYDIPKSLDESDLILSRSKLKTDGQQYAGTMDVRDPRCSPFYGDSKDVGEISIFIGTKDILHPDSLRFKQKAEKLDYDLSFYEYQGMQHGFIIFPIDEAELAIDDMIEFLHR